MDVIFDNITNDWIIFQAIIANIIIIPFLLQLRINKNSRTIRFSGTILSSGVIFILLLCFCLFATYDGDYFSYYNNFKLLSINPTTVTGMEEIYAYIVKYRIVDDYIYFRLIVWGGGLLLYWLSFCRLKINTPIIWTIFTATTLLNVAYIRAILGMGCLLYGYTFLVKPFRYKILSYIIGLGIIFISYFFHKSMFILIGCSIISLLPFNKWMIVLSVASFPIVCAIAIQVVIASIDTEQAGLNYLQSEVVNGGLGVKIYEYLRAVVVFGCMAILFIKLYKKNLTKIQTHFVVLGYMVLFTYMLFIFIFKSAGMGGQYLCDRIFVMIFTIFPILYYIIYKDSKYPRLVAIGLYVATIALNYRLIYSYYLQGLGLGINA